MHKHLSENARLVTYKPDDRLLLLRSFTVPERSAVFEELSPYVQQSILSELRTYEIIEMFNNLDMLQVERALARIPDVKRRKRIIKQLKGDIREKAEYFLRFHPQATLSLINFNYLFLASSLTVGEAAAIIDEHYEETGKYPELLVHEHGRLIGEVPFSSLVRERNNTVLKKHVRPITTINYQTSVPEIIETLVSTNSKKTVVLDNESIIGIIYADTVKPFFSKLPAESLYDFAGVDDSERPFDSVRKKVSNRYRWLILNLATTFLAGFVVLAFTDTLDELAVLAVYIPIVAGMAGNAATQSFAIMVRGITLGTITLQNSAPAIRKEVAAGFLNGLIIGVLVVVISPLWTEGWLFGLVAGLALVGVHMLASLAGSLVPLIMRNFGKDPAATSSIFITTVTDVSSLLLLLGLATLILI
jgi:magnesium transporter